MTNGSAPYSREALASLLAFYAEAGLDFPVADEAVDRFKSPESTQKPTATEPVPTQTAPSPQPAAPAPPATANTPPLMSDDQAFALANAAAAEAQNLDELATAIAAFEGCSLKRTARHTVFEGGTRGAPLMMILEAPSRDDDQAGHTFQGETGRLLKAMLAAIGIERDEASYAGYCVPWHPPGGQPPTERHLRACRPFLDRQITLAQPEVLLVLGNTAARALIDPKGTIMHLRGGPHRIDVEGRALPVFATFDPKFLLGEPAQKRNAWLDLLSLKAHRSGAD